MYPTGRVKLGKAAAVPGFHLEHEHTHTHTWKTEPPLISQGPIHTLAFSPNGKFLASGATDGRVLLWDIGHGLMVGELKGHTDTIYSLRFSRDGELLASGAYCITLLNQLKLQNSMFLCSKLTPCLF